MSDTPDWRALVAAEGADLGIVCAMPSDPTGCRIYDGVGFDDIWPDGRYWATAHSRHVAPQPAIRSALKHRRAELDRRIAELQAAQGRLGPMAHNRGESRTTRSEA